MSKEILVNKDLKDYKVLKVKLVHKVQQVKKD